jgi:hypothetical protein
MKHVVEPEFPTWPAVTVTSSLPEAGTVVRRVGPTVARSV